VTSLQPIAEALFVKRRDSGDLFFVFRGRDGNQYKAHIGSMSLLADFRPELKVFDATELTAHELGQFSTLR
ncbi:MAG: hypothetical protein WBB22_02755, partial [Anaerolineae bacterium]